MQGPQPSEQHQSSEALNAQNDPAKDEAREARETLKKEWDEAIRKTKPRDTAAGLKSGLATAAAGVASGVVGLFAAPIVGAKQDGASGFAKGLATGTWGSISWGPCRNTHPVSCGLGTSSRPHGTCMLGIVANKPWTSSRQINGVFTLQSPQTTLRCTSMELHAVPCRADPHVHLHVLLQASLVLLCCQ
jgi:hypothetical protein